MHRTKVIAPNTQGSHVSHDDSNDEVSMTLFELKQLVDNYTSIVQNFRKDLEVCVVVKTPGSVGGTPVVKVKSAHCGIDWDSGKFMIYTEEDVMRANHKTIEDVRKEAEKIGWDMYEVRGLKAEVKRLRKMLEAEGVLDDRPSV